MKQNYIDKFFKKKLEHREFAFSEEAWLAAEKMIDAQEKKRWWFPYRFLTFLLPFLVGGALLFFYQIDQGRLPHTQNGMRMIPAIGTSTTEQRTTPPNETSLNQTNLDALPAGDASIISKTKEKEVVVSPVIPTDKNIFDNNTVTNETLLNKKETELERNNWQPIQTIESETILPLEKKKKAPQAFFDTPVVEDEKKMPNNSITSSSNQEEVATPKETIASSESQNAITAIDIKSLDFQFAKEAPVRKEQSLTNFKAKRFGVGLLSGAIFTPSFNDQVIGLSGANIGGTFSWMLNARWSAHADLLYEFHGRNYAFPNGNNSLSTNYQTYGFGVNDNYLNVKVKQSHLVNLPLYFKYKLDRHSLDLGMQISYTLGLRGQYEEEIIAPIETASVRVSKESWLDSDKISPFQFNLMTGYQFAISKKVAIGLRAVVVPSRLPRQGRDADDAFNPLELFQISEDAEEGEAIPIFTHNAVNFHLTFQYNLNPEIKQITKPFLAL